MSSGLTAQIPTATQYCGSRLILGSAGGLPGECYAVVSVRPHDPMAPAVQHHSTVLDFLLLRGVHEDAELLSLDILGFQDWTVTM